MNLLTVMSMCHGAHLISRLQPIEPSPVWALIGGGYEMFPCRLQEAFEALYTKLLSALNDRAAIEAMNARHADGKMDLAIDIYWGGRAEGALQFGSAKLVLWPEGSLYGLMFATVAAIPGLPVGIIHFMGYNGDRRLSAACALTSCGALLVCF